MNNLNYHDIIEEEGFYIATLVGNSMLPMLRSRIDSVKIVKPKMPLKKGTLILYQQKNGTYSLRRILKIKKGKYFTCGVGEGSLRKGIKSYQVIGSVEGYFRKEKYISCSRLRYKIYVFFWTKTRPFRYLFSSIFRRNKNGSS